MAKGAERVGGGGGGDRRPLSVRSGSLSRTKAVLSYLGAPPAKRTSRATLRATLLRGKGKGSPVCERAFVSHTGRKIGEKSGIGAENDRPRLRGQQNTWRLRVPHSGQESLCPPPGYHYRYKKNSGY